MTQSTTGNTSVIGWRVRILHGKGNDKRWLYADDEYPETDLTDDRRAAALYESKTYARHLYWGWRCFFERCRLDHPDNLYHGVRLVRVTRKKG